MLSAHDAACDINDHAIAGLEDALRSLHDGDALFECAEKLTVMMCSLRLLWNGLGSEIILQVHSLGAILRLLSCTQSPLVDRIGSK